MLSERDGTIERLRVIENHLLPLVLVATTAGLAQGWLVFGSEPFGLGFALVVFASGPPAEVALPAVVFAVVQMTTSPLVARVLAGRADARNGD